MNGDLVRRPGVFSPGTVVYDAKYKHILALTSRDGADFWEDFGPAGFAPPP